MEKGLLKIIGEMGTALKSLREELGISAYEVAKRAKANINTILAVESGKTNYTIGSFMLYLRGLGLSLEFSLQDDKDKTDEPAYSLQPSAKSPNVWICTDVENKIVCSFEHKKFNDTQKVTILEDVVSSEKAEAHMASVAAAMRRMSDWLVKNHPEKL
jgi:transcriptional regulator with XRE-family HTH domain